MNATYIKVRGELTDL